MNTIAVVGASLAGLSAARALRSQGYDGRLVLIGDETHRPYDRPPLSKEFLAGLVSDTDLALEDETEDLDITWVLGATAAGLSARERGIRLADGRSFRADGVVVATGAAARAFPGGDRLGGVHTLRTLDDARALRTDLARAERLVVVGAGFIGAEIASTARRMGLHVSLVEPGPGPLAAALGPEMGVAMTALHAEHGVDVLCGIGVRELTGTRRVRSVLLADGRRLPADVVAVGIGARPNVGWLAGLGVETGDGVLCDAGGGSSVPGVVAVGDCAAWFDAFAGRHRRVEHWTGAVQRSAIAVRTLLSGGTAPVEPAKPPYFWSDQYGLRIQFVGQVGPGDILTVEEGDIADHCYLAVYRRHDQPVAVLGVNQPRLFTRWRKRLETGLLQSVPR